MSLMIKPGSGVPTPPEELRKIYYNPEKERQRRFVAALDLLIDRWIDIFGRKTLIRNLLYDPFAPLEKEDIIYLGIVDNEEELKMITDEIDEDINKEVEEREKRKGLAVLDQREENKNEKH